MSASARSSRRIGSPPCSLKPALLEERAAGGLGGVGLEALRARREQVRRGKVVERPAEAAAAVLGPNADPEPAEAPLAHLPAKARGRP